jgi:hypothetical protein
VYANSLFATLNARAAIRNDLHDVVSHFSISFVRDTTLSTDHQRTTAGRQFLQGFATGGVPPRVSPSTLGISRYDI